ncbi:hypothetical protein E2F43_18945 [Seongchinamella unica]|uniref:Uncharacterized protein n=1 Tax=Seongchinamella unica TaxID=2547392 RepID=A0A4R5LMX2_9GAMM|nr:hypothetical protein [Seongchinamella unica]TDG11274.1 hypothetical protein E2F43_18945 [Seongchinamella unica]
MLNSDLAPTSGEKIVMIKYNGLLFCALSLLTSNISLAQPPTPDVNVINTQSNPIPVKVQGGIAPMPVLIQASISLNEQGASTLFIGSRFEACVGSIPVCESAEGRYSVPEGKQLVIKHVSFRSRSLFVNPPPEPVGATLEFRKNDTNGNTLLSQSFQFGLLEAIDPQLAISGKGFHTQITLPPGTQVVGRLTWAQFFDGRRDGSFSIAGEYIDVP